MNPRWIAPDWPAPRNVRAAVTTRAGGVSVGAYSSLNLGTHVGDSKDAVLENRRRVRDALGLIAEPTWLNQVHGTNVIEAGEYDEPPTADASFSVVPGAPCVVLTADCLPVIFCDDAGTRVAAAHAGWRGLADGVLAATVGALGVRPTTLLAWLGPAIEQSAFEVGNEVRERFVEASPSNAHAFVRNERSRWQADLSELARLELQRLGVSRIHGGRFDCHRDSARFFSYRRDGVTGRMGTFVWME
jgi:YfiH family protein